MTKKLRKTEGEKNIERAGKREKERESKRAVSYTHLDVYKRQPQ